MSQMNANAMNALVNGVIKGINIFSAALDTNDAIIISPKIGEEEYGSAGRYVADFHSGQYYQDWYGKTEGFGHSAVAMGTFAYDVVDSIRGGNKSDIIYGGWGNAVDYLAGGGYYHDTVNGGNDIIFGGGGDNGIATYAGDDLVVAGWDLATNPGIGTNYLNTWYSALAAGTFHTNLTDFGGNNNIGTGIGNDTIITGSGNDAIDAGAYEAAYATREDNDLVYAGGGNDTVYGRYGSDTLFAEAGVDTLYGGDGNDFLYGGTEGDGLFGGAGNDNLFGEAGDDNLHGENGNDGLLGGAGADTIDGGEGIDLASYETSAGAVEIDLSNVSTTDGYAQGKFSDAEGDKLLGIENLLGSVYGDLLAGNDGNNVINGNAGNDEITGQAGDDTLWGGAGDDYLAGNAGFDHLLGGAGNDFYFFGIGSGVESVYENANEGADYAYLTGLTNIGVYKNGNDLWLAANNDDVMMLKDWYLSNNVEYVYFQSTQQHFTTQEIAQYAQDITPTATAMFMGNATMQDVPSIINTDIQLNSDIIALAGMNTSVPIELA